MLASTGIAMAKHYCSDKLNSVSIFSGEGKECACKKAGESSCCHEESTFFKVNDNHQGQSFLTKFSQQFSVVILSLFYSIELPVLTEEVSGFYTSYKSPPIQDKQPIFVTNCVWII